MPTFTAAAFDRLLEPDNRNSVTKPPPVPIKVETERRVNNYSVKKSAPRPNISPTLYATPETTQLPDSPSSFPPPSPYIINHKRRGRSLVKSLPQNVVVGTQSPTADLEQKVDVVTKNETKAVANDLQDGKIDWQQHGESSQEECGETVAAEIHQGQLKDANLNNGVVGSEVPMELLSVDQEADGENEDFFDPQDSLSTASNMEVDDATGTGRWKPVTPLGEYYDAFEEISSDGAVRSYPNIVDEMREMRLNLLMEIERRKQAEDTLENLQNKWQMLSHYLSLVGLRLPIPPTVAGETDEQSDVNPAVELYQQVVVSHIVDDAIGRACSRAEVEMEMEPLIESKNFEIARLWDRLNYYEAANKEMCQRNQEAVEMAREHRYRRKRRQKWFWSSIGLTVTLGAAAIAWSYFPVSRPSHEDIIGRQEK